MIQHPNDQARAIALGARFAVEQEYEQRLVALANERDQALARAVEAERERDEVVAAANELSRAASVPENSA